MTVSTRRTIHATVLRSLTAVALPVGVLIGWWWQTRGATSIYFPPPADVARAFADNWLFAEFGTHVVPSLTRLLAGFALAIILGIALGVPIGLSSLIRRGVMPYLALMRSMPGSALVLVFLALFGAGTNGKILTIAYVAVFPTLLNTIDGVRSLEPTLRDVSTSYRLTQRQHIFSVVLPAALPQIFVGIRTSMSLAFIVMVVAEYQAGSNGIGYFTRDRSAAYLFADMWSGMVLLGALGLCLNAAVLLAQRRMLRWYDGVRAHTNAN